MTRALVGAVALALALAGCGGDPKADPSPTPSSPATSPVSTTPSAPALPDEAKANTKAGAIAFVRYYIALINHAQATGDVDALAAVEDPGCRSCISARQTLGDIYQSGGHIEGGALDASIGGASPRPDLKGWTVIVTARFGPQDVVRSDGATHLKGGRSLITFVVRHSEESWTVLQWSRGS
jgi:Family of unknown function (DUF6318)